MIRKKIYLVFTPKSTKRKKHVKNYVSRTHKKAVHQEYIHPRNNAKKRWYKKPKKK